VALQDRAARVADVIAVLLQAGCHLEFIGKDVFAKAVRVAAAGSFLGGGVLHTALGPGRPGADDENGEKTKSVKHGVPHKCQRKKEPRGPPPFSGIGPY
jgi:hypothetical protein